MSPEPGIKKEADSEQVNRIEKLLGSEGFPSIQRQQQRCCEKQKGEQQEEVINNGRQAAQKTRY